MKLTYSAIKIEFMWSYDCLGIRLLPLHLSRLLFIASSCVLACSFFLIANLQQPEPPVSIYLARIDIKYLVTYSAFNLFIFRFSASFQRQRLHLPQDTTHHLFAAPSSRSCIFFLMMNKI